MKNVKIVLLVVVVSLTMFLPKFVQGETYVEDFEITEDTVWKNEHGPYILQSSVVVHDGATLTIEPGVVVKFDLGYLRLVIFGGLNAIGTKEDPIHFTSYYNSNVGGNSTGDENATPYEFLDLNNWGVNLYSDTSKATINNANFSFSGGFGGVLTVFSPHGALLENIHIDTVNYGILGVEGEFNLNDASLTNINGGGILLFDDIQATISSTTIENVGFDDALGFYDSVPASVTGLTIKNADQTAVGIYGDGDIEMEKSVFKDNSIGVGIYSWVPPQLQMENSVVEDNREYGVVNNSGYVVNMQNNWWGSVLGPVAEDNIFGEGNTVIGNVEFKPWLESDPFEVKPECCSSVAFMPGLQASRLYKDGILGTNKLWEPNRRDDVRKLYLNESGESVEDGIYANGVIDNAYEPLGIGVYDKFIKKMDEMVQMEEINDWKMFPYDWRFGYDEIIQTYDLVKEIEELALHSKTGKVTVVAHSNGGLLTKALVNALEQEHSAHLIDTIIFIAVPQLGTPSAIAALLHGEDTSIAGGSFLSREVGRVLGENMPSAYNLLPSEKYLNSSTLPVVQFDASLNEINNFFQFYGDGLVSQESLIYFLSGAEGREKPSILALNEPNIVNGWLYAKARATHETLDSWQAPEGIKIIQIGGVGSATLSGLTYVATDVCRPMPHAVDCSRGIGYLPNVSFDGDGTVILSSAIQQQLESDVYYLDLKRYNSDHFKNSSHAFVFEIDELNSFIQNTITNFPHEGNYLSQTKPENTDYRRIEVVMHSPAAIHIYDESGNHTGVIESTDSDITKYVENVPNSYYLQFDEAKYISGTTQNVKELKIVGEGEGTFTLDVNHYEGSELIATSTFKNVLVTPHLKGDIHLVDTVPVLNLDIDGDGLNDVSLDSTKVVDVTTRLQILRKTVELINLDPKTREKLTKKIDKLLKAKEIKVEKVHKLFEKYPLEQIEEILNDLEAV